MSQTVSRPKRLSVPIEFDAMADTALVRLGQFVASEDTLMPAMPGPGFIVVKAEFALD
jgi:hypothetical protein